MKGRCNIMKIFRSQKQHRNYPALLASQGDRIKKYQETMNKVRSQKDPFSFFYR